MSEKVITYTTYKNDTKHALDYKQKTTSLAYLRCAKLHKQYVDTKISGVKYFFVAKDVAAIDAYGDVVIRVEYFDEGKLKTKLIFVKCEYGRNHVKDFIMDIKRIRLECFDSFIQIFNVLQTDETTACHSRAQHSETASDLQKEFNCNFSDCEFVCYSNTHINNKDDYKSLGPLKVRNKEFDIIEEILGTHTWLRFGNIGGDELEGDHKYNHLKSTFFDHFSIMLNVLVNIDTCIIEEIQSSLQCSDSDSQMVRQIFNTKMEDHFKNTTCEVLSEKSNFLQKLKDEFGLKLLPKETIDPSCSTGYPSALHVVEETELHKAAEQNHVEKMGELVYHDPTLLNSRDRDGKTPLHIACEMASSEAVKFLLKNLECLLDVADVNGKLALHYAAENGNVGIMKNLLTCDQEIRELINKKDINGETPLYIACKYGRTDAVKLLLNHPRCLVDVGCEKLPLHCAAENGYVEILKLLLKRDSKILNKPDKDDETALHLACAVGCSAVVDFLLSRDFLKLDCTDKWGNTCFHTAALSKDCNILSALLGRNPDLLNNTNKKYRTALHVAASIRNDNVIEFLLNLDKCDVNVRDENKDTALHLYVNGYKRTHFDIRNTDINVFKQKCRSLVNIFNQDGETPLYKAVQVADHESVKKLIAMGADVNKISKYGTTLKDLAYKLVDSFERKSILSNLSYK